VPKTVLGAWLLMTCTLQSPSESDEPSQNAACHSAEVSRGQLTRTRSAGLSSDARSRVSWACGDEELRGQASIGRFNRMRPHHKWLRLLRRHTGAQGIAGQGAVVGDGTTLTTHLLSRLLLSPDCEGEPARSRASINARTTSMKSMHAAQCNVGPIGGACRHEAAG
jgi:hypothetical protein